MPTQVEFLLTKLVKRVLIMLLVSRDGEKKMESNFGISEIPGVHFGAKGVI